MAYLKFTSIVLMLVLSGQVTANDDEHAVADSLHVDIGDVKAARSVRPVDGVTSAGQPDREALEVFANSGYAAVIDLRGAEESRGIDEAGVVEDLGMSYVPFPIAGTEAINFENAATLQRLIDSQDGPVLVHCGSGNRVGALLALAEALRGADDDAAIAAGKEGGLTRLEPVVRERLSDRAKSN
ncbi:MAG: hypothetical protein HKN77_10615 [Woeseiaceae bacterium]|nr:hypothetical protein [Woeseiaceae bacterium]